MTELPSNIDVLQNLERALLTDVDQHPELCNYDLAEVIDEAIAYYKSEKRQQSELTTRLKEPLATIFKRVIKTSEMSLGRTLTFLKR